MTPKIKNIIIFSGIALAFILIYIFFIKSSPPQANLESTANTPLPNIDGTLPGASTINTNSQVAKEFLTLLSSVKNIKLDDVIFSDQAFNTLRDSSITLIPDGTEGRPNPFAQFGNDTIPLPIDALNPDSAIPPVVPPITPPAKP
ncbi:MAG: hypothetical protein WC847_00220 [Candidatus Paceibacterota bacterium]|jgi:hypothetical protein